MITWRPIAYKKIPDTRGYYQDYVWYTDGEKHIFMFGDTDNSPSVDHADWIEYDIHTAYKWFHKCNGWD